MMITAKEEKEVIDNLYKAVQEWIEVKGGKAIIAAGITIQDLPDSGKVWDEFIVGVKICGKKPKPPTKQEKE